MKIIASLAISADGFTDDNSSERLTLSCDKDWAAVYALRGDVDAIMIGAETLRRDNPSLLVKLPEIRCKREACGQCADIVKIVLTHSSELDLGAKFFTTGEAAKIVVCDNELAKSKFEKVADVVVLDELNAPKIIDALKLKGIEKLMIEGGVTTLTQFFSENVVDEFRLAVSKKVVGDENAPKFHDFETFLGDKAPNMKLFSKQFLGETTVYNFVKKDDYYLEMAIAESLNAVPTQTNYRVGAVIETLNGEVFRGYTGETNVKNHAEEEAIKKALDANVNLCGAVIYTSMEPCSKRASKPKSCSELILENSFSKVVYAYKEPDFFVQCEATNFLIEKGVIVVVNDALADSVKQINSHILG